MNYFLKDDNIILRKLSEDDNMENYLTFINDVENLVWVESIGNLPLIKEDLKTYLRSNNNLFLSIFNHDKLHVGNIHLGRINFIHRNAEFGMILDKQAQGKGYATSASRLVLRHAFEMLNLHRIYLSVVTENKSAIRLYERLGFVEEGIEKDMHLYNFKYYDVIRYRMLEDEYLAIQNNI